MNLFLDLAIIIEDPMDLKDCGSGDPFMKFLIVSVQLILGVLTE